MSATQVGDFQAETHSVEVSADIRALIPIICGLTTGGLVIKADQKILHLWMIDLFVLG